MSDLLWSAGAFLLVPCALSALSLTAKASKQGKKGRRSIGCGSSHCHGLDTLPRWSLNLNEPSYFTASNPPLSSFPEEIVSFFDRFNIDTERGFLPRVDPITCLPNPLYEPWEEVACDLSKLLATWQIRPVLASLEVLPTDQLLTDGEKKRAHLLLSMFAHAYVWGSVDGPLPSLPAGVAVPLWAMSQELGMAPVLTHGAIVLNNWRRLDPNGPLSLDNLVTLHNFLNGWDESWFYLVTLEVESSGAPALLPAIQLALMFRECAKEEGKEMDLHAVLAHLEKLKEAILAMTGAMKRMKDGCEPFIFYHRVRPFLAAWKSNPTLPNGIIYEGVSEEPMEFYGGSAAQSALIPLVDITLGISHASTNSNAFLMEMRNYMFRPHRELLAWLEETPGNVKELIESLEESHPLYDDLKKVYNKCVRFFHAFRSVHTGFVREYIVDQQRPGEGKDYSKEEVEGDHTSRKGLSNSAGGKGTGGTDLEEFLTPINNNTRDSVIGEQKED